MVLFRNMFMKVLGAKTKSGKLFPGFHELSTVYKAFEPRTFAVDSIPNEDTT